MAVAKEKDYSEDQKMVALAFYKALGNDLAKAARQSKVDKKTLALWVAGGDPIQAREETEALIRELAPSKVSRLDLDEDDEDLDYDEREFRKGYEQRRAELFLAEGRPLPPVHLASPMRTPVLVMPDLDLEEWVRKHFIGREGEPVSKLHNPDHWHLALEDCKIGFLWTNVECRFGGNSVIGMAEMVGKCGNKWQTAEYHYHLRRWFGDVPTFLIRLDSVWCAQATDAEFGALIDHELYHCSLRMDEHGQPKVDRFGNYTFSEKGHAVEEHIGVVRRWGAKASGAATLALVEAANRPPEIAEVDIRDVCCGCGRGI
ncbi:MAG: hypothetical protein EON58_09830 [Alphaproteobacteria bacterium]|nr:MAG: hypothetical protein EON58_09830 [Alphaproteobacteria bacterium]